MDLFILPERERPTPPPSLMSRAGVMAIFLAEIVPERVMGLVFERVYVLPGALLSPNVRELVATRHRPVIADNVNFVYGDSAQEAWDRAKDHMWSMKPPVPKIPLEVRVAEVRDHANFSIKLAAASIALSLLGLLLQLASILGRM